MRLFRGPGCLRLRLELVPADDEFVPTSNTRVAVKIAWEQAGRGLAPAGSSPVLTGSSLNSDSLRPPGHIGVG
jgi:hypothetical protein